MKSVIFATLVLLAGCGGYRSRPVVTPYPQPTPQPYPGQPGLDAFVVDAGVGVYDDVFAHVYVIAWALWFCARSNLLLF